MFPESKLTKKQKKTFRKDVIINGDPVVIIAEVRHDDECGNGHNTFAITAKVYEKYQQPHEPTVTHENGKTLWLNMCGCCHEIVAKHFPELAPLLKWHLVSTDYPLHYYQNTVYHSGDRDCWGLRKGEFRQHTSRGSNQNGGVAGVPNWELKIPKDLKTDVYAMEKPAPVLLEWQPSGMTGEGKEREFDHARSSAVWPDATDEQLSLDPEELKKLLAARLSALMAEFKAAVESLGFIY